MFELLGLVGLVAVAVGLMLLLVSAVLLARRLLRPADAWDL